MKTQTVLLSLVCFFTLAVIQTAIPAENKPLDPTPTFRWKDWNIELSPDGNVQHLFISYDEVEELQVLTRLSKADEERRRKEHGIEPNKWKIVYTLSKETDMIFRDLDGTRYRETAGMGRSDLEWALKNEQQYYDMAYAYSRGNVKIIPTRRIMEEPLLGEYANVCFFWPRDWPDLGIGIDNHEYDSVVGLYYPGPTRPWARGGTGGGGGWCANMGHTSVQFAPGREVGGPIGDISKIIRHEWLHQIDGQRGWKCGYLGLPGQYAPGNYHHGANMFWMRYMLVPRMWQTMRMQAPLMSPPNKPQDRYTGFIREWLLLGEFDLPVDKRSTGAGIPHPNALDIDAINPALTMPDEGMESSAGNTWRLFSAPWDQSGIDMRRVFLSPHKDAYAYAHVYVHSPEQREAILWIGSMEPFTAYLNGNLALKCWRGTAQDEGIRKVILMEGWNRLLVKKLDQEGRTWQLFARFTGAGHEPMEDLEFSALLPESGIIPTESAVPPPPVEIRHYRWEYPYDNDWFGSLPVLHEEHLDAILGVKGVRILGAPGTLNERNLNWEEQRYTLIDVSAVDKPEKILSRVIPWNAEKATLENDVTLNNVLNMSRDTGGFRRSFESMALIRYRKDTGTTGDLVFVRADMIEPFMDLGKIPDDKPDWKHSERIAGFICRDSKTFLVFDTDLGGRTPANEMDMLVSKDEYIQITAGPNAPRVLRGQDCAIEFRIRNIGGQDLSPVLEIREFASDNEPVRVETGTIKTGEEKIIAMPVDTNRSAGLITYFAELSYAVDGTERKVDKPVPVNLFDAVSIEVRVDGPEILMAPNQKVIVKVSNNLDEPVSGTLRPRLPGGFSARPGSVNFTLSRLDETQTYIFDMTVTDRAPDGMTELAFEADVRKRGTLTSRGSLPVSKAFGEDLVNVDFEDGITGDFAFTNAHYFVKINKVAPRSGKQCLEIFDRGGARYGHVAAFGHGPHHPGLPYPPDTQYVYDTKMYPYVEFWFKTEHKNDNIGLHVVLDDGENGYGFLINGLWVQQWVPRIMIGKVDFEANGEWQHIVINIDEALDGIRGKTSHFVKEILIGDTRTFASGWWYYFDTHRHYLDDFRITKGPSKAKEHILRTDSGLKMFDRSNRVPAFNSEVSDGLKSTCRFTQLGYFPWEMPQLELWLTNLSGEPLTVAVWDITRLWETNVTTTDGEPVTDGWVSRFWRPEQQEPPEGRPPRDSGIPHTAENFRVLKPGESILERRNIFDFINDWAFEQERKTDPSIPHGEAWKRYLKPGGEYIVRVRYRSQFSGQEFGHEAWTGTIEANPVRLTLHALPSMEEELTALKTSPDQVRRAKACAQLGKDKYEPAIEAICTVALNDADDVRLNAVWALGEFGRVDTAKPETVEKLRPVVEVLIKALDDENWRVGEYAASSLGRIGDHYATPSLLKRLDSEIKWVRRRTANALYDLNDHSVSEKLGAMMSDTSREVRMEVQKTLNRILIEKNRQLNQDNHLLEDFNRVFALAMVAADDEYWEIRRKWIADLPEIKNNADVLTYIVRALDDRDENVREAAIRAIGHFGKDAPDEAKQKVIALLGDYYDAVRRAAVENVSRLHDGKSIQELTGHDNIYWLRKYPRPGDMRYRGQ